MFRTQEDSEEKNNKIEINYKYNLTFERKSRKQFISDPLAFSTTTLAKSDNTTICLMTVGSETLISLADYTLVGKRKPTL